MITFFIVWLFGTNVDVIADQIERRFDSEIFRDPLYLVSYDEGYVRPIEDGIRYLWMDRNTTFPGSSVKSQYGLRGDFEIDLLFNINYLGPPASGWGSGILLRLDFRDHDSTGISLQRQVRTNGEHVVSIDETRNGLKEHKVQAIPISAAKDIDGFRVRRTGDQLEIASITDCICSDTVWTIHVSQADVFPVGFHLHSGDSIADIDVVLQSFRIEADQIITRDHVADPFAITRYVLAGATMLLLVGCLIVRAGFTEAFEDSGRNMRKSRWL